MKPSFIFLLLLCGLHSPAQVIQYNYDRKLEYKIEHAGQTFAVIYSSDQTLPVLTTQYAEGFGKDLHSSVSWRYSFRGTTYELSGTVMNGSYFSCTGYSGQKMNDGPETFILSDELWTVDGYKDCRMYYLPGSQGQLQVFVYNREDNEDYSNACNALLQVNGLPSLQLDKGWVIVTGEIYVRDDKRYFALGTLEDRHQPVYQALFINQEDIDLTLGGTTEQRLRFYNTAPYPGYCEVIAWQYDLDSATTEQASTFFGDMCTYFNLFGRYDLQEFQAYYLREAEKRAAHYRKHELLNAGQAALFRKELIEHQPANLERNLMR